MIQIPAAWKDIIPAEIPTFPLERVTPAPENIFRAFELIRPEDVKFVILGQDPYIGVGQATGVAFSVPEWFKIPPSLKNIFWNLKKFNHIENIPSSGNLEWWSNHGVLLMNCSLTTELGKSNAHWIIWRNYTEKILKNLTGKVRPKFLLFGKFAIDRMKWYDGPKLCCSHPSPMSFSRPAGEYPPFEQTDVFSGVFEIESGNDLKKE